MKYSSIEREKVVKKGLKLHHEIAKKRNTLRKEFPVEVEIKDGFYIIKSQMNKE